MAGAERLKKKSNFLGLRHSDVEVDAGNPTVSARTGRNINVNNYRGTYTVDYPDFGVSKTFAEGRVRLKRVITNIVLPAAVAGTLIAGVATNGFGLLADRGDGDLSRPGIEEMQTTEINPLIISLAQKFLNRQMNFAEFMELTENQQSQLFFFIFQGGRVSQEEVIGILEHMETEAEKVGELQDIIIGPKDEKTGERSGGLQDQFIEHRDMTLEEGAHSKTENTQPSATQPSVSQPSASQPSASQPSASQPPANEITVQPYTVGLYVMQAFPMAEETRTINGNSLLGISWGFKDERGSEHRFFTSNEYHFDSKGVARDVSAYFQACQDEIARSYQNTAEVEVFRQSASDAETYTAPESSGVPESTANQPSTTQQPAVSVQQYQTGLTIIEALPMQEETRNINGENKLGVSWGFRDENGNTHTFFTSDGYHYDNSGVARNVNAYFEACQDEITRGFQNTSARDFSSGISGFQNLAYSGGETAKLSTLTLNKGNEFYTDKGVYKNRETRRGLKKGAITEVGGILFDKEGTML